MPELRLIPVEDIMNKAQLKKLEQKLADAGIDDLDWEGDSDEDLEEVLTEDQLTDFMDRLDARDLACDIYLPVEFEGRIEIGDHAVGSAQSLLEVLEELREELAIDEDEDEEEEEDLDLDVIESQLRATWRTFLKSATTCVEKQVPLQIIS